MFSEIDKKYVRSDCVSVRDVKNNILKHWCLSEHIDELRRLGIEYRTSNKIPFFGIKQKDDKDVYEISHFNSAYEIKKNQRSDKDNVFKAGNYIINDWGAENIIFVLDNQMKKVLWHKKLNFFNEGRSRLRVHDVQVTDEGNILAYVNSVSVQAKKFNSSYTQLVEFDPYTDEIYWVFFDKPKENFFSKILGSVKKLDNGNYLYSDVTNGGRAFEITREGKKIWNFKNPIKDADGKPMVFQSIIPFKNMSFLRARNVTL